ncbi:unnamed protein product [Lactuca virosa]|uniref:F-box domain-containing protein n=1 Tax=Lactuca virosa TaxID=75947 RepID=A0AAU9M5E6_9ASTR|nr:unnamed protein product [Lactuca virosa]
MIKAKSTSNSHGNASSRKSFWTSDNSGGAPWSDLNHGLLFLVLMQLGAFDFLSFSGVCKSWRSVALSKKTRFMASRPPMAIWITKHGNKKEYCVEDFEGRNSIILLPKSDRRTCVGLTCGYLVLFGRRSHDFWLVNHITRHGLHFPNAPYSVSPNQEGVRAILRVKENGIVFTLSIPSVILHEFKGKIYAIDADSFVHEIGLDPEPKLILLKANNFLGYRLEFMEFVCTDENLYAMECFPDNKFKVHELDFGEMKWVSPKKETMEEYAFFVSGLKHSAAIKRELLSDSWLRYKRNAYSDTSGNGMFFTADTWYIPNEWLKVKSHI